MEHYINSDYIIHPPPFTQTMLGVLYLPVECLQKRHKFYIHFNIKKYYFNLKIYLENQTPDFNTVTFKDEGKIPNIQFKELR